jgi:hypothetical protein
MSEGQPSLVSRQIHGLGLRNLAQSLAAVYLLTIYAILTKPENYTLGGMHTVSPTRVASAISLALAHRCADQACLLDFRIAAATWPNPLQPYLAPIRIHTLGTKQSA